jgi:hypothetical protein
MARWRDQMTCRIGRLVGATSDQLLLAHHLQPQVRAHHFAIWAQ